MNSTAWSQSLRLWLPGAVFFGLMVALSSVFALRFADQAEVARVRLERRAEELESLRSKRMQAEAVIEQIRSSEEGLEDFYGRRLSSESRALTKIIAEIKDLASRAGIPPEALNYERQQLEGQDVSRHRIRFSVNGTYAQLRQLINFFELSESFLILDEVALSGNDVEGSPLRITLTLSTLFAAEPDTPLPPATDLES